MVAVSYLVSMFVYLEKAGFQFKMCLCRPCRNGGFPVNFDGEGSSPLAKGCPCNGVPAIEMNEELFVLGRVLLFLSPVGRWEQEGGHPPPQGSTLHDQGLYSPSV